MLKKILLAVAAILAVLLVVIALRPSTYRVTRTATIAAPPDRVVIQRRLIRFSRRMPQRIVEVRGPRRISRARDRQRARQRQRRNTATLDFSRDQSDGLMADGSDGHQQDDVHAISNDATRQLRRQSFAHAP